MTLFKKVLSASLSLALLLGALSGCSSVSSDTSNSSSVDQTAGSQAVGNAEPTPITIFANFTPGDEEKQANKDWQASVEAACNIKITLEIPPSTGFAERQQIMLASGDYPDVIFFSDPAATTFTDAVDEGIIIPVTQYVNAAESLQKYSYSFSWDALKVKGDDEIYGIPRTTIQRRDGFLVRADWLDAVGFTVPEDNILTKDQFKELLNLFTFNDPDQNGKNDTYGVSMSVDGNGNMGPLVSYAFGDLGWQAVSGETYEYMTPMYDRKSDVYKNALQYTTNLMTAGVIDPNSTSQKADAAKQRFLQGVSGIWFEYAGWYADALKQLQDVNPNARLTYINGIKNDAGVFEGTAYGTGIWGFWAISSAAKNPEACVNLFDYMLSDDGWDTTKYGIEGSTYTIDNGEKVATEAYSDFTIGRAFVRRNNDPGFFISLATTPEVQEKVEGWLDTAIKAVVPSLDYGYSPDAAKEASLIDYNSVLSATMSKILIGAESIDSWDEALDGWYEAGGSDYVDQMTTHIKELQGK